MEKPTWKCHSDDYIWTLNRKRNLLKDSKYYYLFPSCDLKKHPFTKQGRYNSPLCRHTILQAACQAYCSFAPVLCEENDRMREIHKWKCINKMQSERK